MLAVLLGCGRRRSELVHLTVDHFQQREVHRAVVDLIGKDCGHIRTVPVPDWVKASVDNWVTATNIARGKLFRCVNKRRARFGTAGSQRKWCGVS